MAFQTRLVFNGLCLHCSIVHLEFKTLKHIFLFIDYFSCFARCQVALRCPRLTANVVAASRRRGYWQGSDESKRCCYLLCVRRVCTPACVKPLVACSGIVKQVLLPFLLVQIQISFDLNKVVIVFLQDLCILPKYHIR